MGSGNWQWKLSGAVLFIALVLGAAAARAEGSGDGHQSGQGTKLYGIDPWFGESLPIRFGSAQYLYRPSRDTSPISISFMATLDHGQLKGTVNLPESRVKKNLVGEDFNDVVFTATGPGNEAVTLTLFKAQHHPNVYQTQLVSRARWDYQVRWSSSKKRGNLCPTGTSALVVPYYTGNSGGLMHDASRFSFACLPQSLSPEEGVQGGGVAAKCSDWGYAPWWVNGEAAFAGAVPGPLSPGQQEALDEKALRYHAACTAMATADYCGEGEPHTLNNTPIVMFDTHDVQAVPVDANDPSSKPHVSLGPVGSSKNFFFEAAWKVDEQITEVSDGTVSVTREVPTLRAQALCLTKKRWSTFPVSRVCRSGIKNLLDPRSIAKGTPEQPYCDDPRDGASLQALLDKGALLFSYSMFTDAGLYRFKQSNPGGADAFLTTADVVIDPIQPYRDSYQPRFAPGKGYKLDEDDARQLKAFEGTVITENGRQSQVFSSVKSQLHPLLRQTQQTNGSTRYLTLVDESATSEAQPKGVIEGYVYLPDETLTPAQRGLVGQWPMLKSWSNGQSQVTSVNGPGLAGYQSTDQEGYVPSLVNYSQFLPQ